MNTDAHAKYAPSSMYLTVACPGWQKQAALMPPEQSTEQSREGDAGHWVAAMYACGNVVAPGVSAPNGVEVSEDMIDGAALWVEALEGYPAHIETPVHMLRLDPYGNCWGTPDARQWNPETKILRVADYKFGHEYVDEYENWQMLAYMIGIIDELAVHDDPNVRLEMTIVQPRYYNGDPIRTWAIRLPETWSYVERMRTAIAEAESDSPPIRSGTHCTHCPARATCRTYQKTVMHAVDFAGRADPMLSAPDDIGRELKLVKEFIKRLEARETGLSALAETMIRQGQRVPYFSLEQSVGRLAWTVPLDVVEMTAKLSGKSALKPPALITPTQAKDRKILADAVVGEYSDRPKGAMRLVPDSTNIKRVFTS